MRKLIDERNNLLVLIYSVQQKYSGIKTIKVTLPIVSFCRYKDRYLTPISLYKPQILSGEGIEAFELPFSRTSLLSPLIYKTRVLTNSELFRRAGNDVERKRKRDTPASKAFRWETQQGVNGSRHAGGARDVSLEAEEKKSGTASGAGERSRERIPYAHTYTGAHVSPCCYA
ncbi:hypothetical protein PUN28_016831 [Cardiocondyla obscurior]|uniref:Uncharacterized protein n=1 Tax=Cardiocondyla obscurior TaxID=286306 RepID=A0AAW2EQ52_9HYME